MSKARFHVRGGYTRVSSGRHKTRLKGFATLAYFMALSVAQKMVDNIKRSYRQKASVPPGNTKIGERLSTVDHLIKVACFVNL